MFCVMHLNYFSQKDGNMVPLNIISVSINCSLNDEHGCAIRQRQKKV